MILSTRSLLLVLSLLCLHSCGTRSDLSERLQGSMLFSSVGEVAVANPDRFSFALVGDLHIGGSQTVRLDHILNDAKAENDDFVILLGDIIDKGEEEDFVAVRNSIKAAGYEGKVFSAIGNHDVFENGWKNFEKYFGPSRFTFKAGHSKFIFLDTADGTVGREQAEWLKLELEEGATNSFIASHYLPVVPGIRTYLKLSSDRESLRLMKLVKDFGVRAWLGGHYHSFVQGAVGGVEYVVAGGGGGKRMEPVLSFFFVQAVVDGASVQFNLREVP